MMKHPLRLKLAAALALTALCGVFFGISAVSGWPVGVTALLGLGIALSLWWAWSLAMGVLHEAYSFAKALEMKDYSIHFPESSDSELNRIHASMNSIVALQRSASNALETRKLYYDRILRIMTHELRNAITPIVSLADDMSRNTARYEGENLAQAASLIVDESRGIKQFLDSYYELTHLPRPDVSIVDARQFFSLISRSIDLICKEMELTGVDLRFNIAEGMELRIDADMMKRAIINLLKNACEATAGSEGAVVELTASMPEGRPYITVTDNGPAMPQNVLDNLFQPFFTTKPGGSGIGLCLSRQIVRLHGGDITAVSTPAQTTFAITL